MNELSETMKESQEAIGGYYEKSEKVIAELERYTSPELALCRRCGGLPLMSTVLDTAPNGEKGFLCTIRCRSCKVSVSVFSISQHHAELRTKNFWNRSVLDLR